MQFFLDAFPRCFRCVQVSWKFETWTWKYLGWWLNWHVQGALGTSRNYISWIYLWLRVKLIQLLFPDCKKYWEVYILILRDYIFPWSRDEVGENWGDRRDKECSCPVVTLSYCNSTILPIQQTFQWAVVKSISYILFIFTEMSYHLSETGRSAARTVHIP